MDKMKLNELKSLLETLQQPAFAVCDSELVYQNPAFRELGDVSSETAKAFISMNQSAALQVNAEAYFTPVGGRGYYVTELPLEDGTLYLFKPNNAYNTANFLSRIVSVQRNSLQEVFAFGLKAIERSDKEPDERTSLENGAFLHGVYRLSRTLENMDLYQQLLIGRRGLHTESVFLRDYFSGLSEKAEELLRQAKLTLHTTLPEQNPPVWLDVELVEAAVWNLLANAGENAPDKVISLRVSLRRRLMIEVGNTGKLPENRRVFNKKQIPPEEDFECSGLGVGIPLLQEITKLHGGGLILESKQEGTRLAASFATDLIGEPTVRSDRHLIKASNEMDRGLVGLSELLPTKCYLSEDILG